MDDYRLTPDGVQARQLTKKELELMQLVGQVFKPGFAAAQAWMSREQEQGREQAAQAATLLPEQSPSVRHQAHAQ